MKKYTPYIAFTAILATAIIGYLLWRKKQINDLADNLTDAFDGTKAKRNQVVYLKKREYLQQIGFYDDGEVFVTGTISISSKTPLIYIGKYNNRFIVRKKGWFFDRNFLVNENQLV